MSCLFKVTKNVINHQVNTYIESKGMDPHTMSKEEKDKHKGAMFKEMYPGRKQTNAMKLGYIINSLNLRSKRPQSRYHTKNNAT